MKITKEFSPLTIKIETSDEKIHLLTILSAASHYYSQLVPTEERRRMLEVLYVFGKDLK